MAPVRIAVLDDYQDIALRSADWEVLRERADVAEIRVLREHLDPDRLVAEIGDCEVVVAMRERTAFPRGVLARLGSLRLLVTTGMINASIDLEAAAAQGVTVCGTSGRGPDTAELAWALVMDLVRGVTAADRGVRDGRWQTGVPGRRLEGLVVGLVGLGGIGTQVARYAHAFGCAVRAWSPNLTEERAAAVGVRAVGKDELFAGSDVVSIHLKLSERSRGLVARPELELVGPGGYLVNTSRGPIVVEDDLVAALRDGVIAGAALDTFDVEPLPADHPLRAEPRAVLTPHLGYVTAEVMSVFHGDAVADVVSWLDGAPVRVLGT
ncbi:D-2-hydroxyacid dehydrogenase family protein [Pseudonocardia nematodicida]|uniref:D-2-hydroxyacid dehydrogenase family protein n=1 Tax=Pseudonocardia nematodicida TaxID=1206997 RepID=A0ABV1KFP8_9PSEU